MTTQELATFIYEHRLECFASGEGGLVEPPELDARELLDLEEWALDQARKHKTKEAYLETQAKAMEKFRKRIEKLKTDYLMAAGGTGQAEGLQIQAELAKLANIKRLLN